MIFNQTIKEDDFLMNTKSILSNPDVFASIGATVDPNSVTAYGKCLQLIILIFGMQVDPDLG